LISILALGKPSPQASYQGGRTRPLKYSIEHPILLEEILGHPIIPKYLSVIVKSKVAAKIQDNFNLCLNIPYTTPTDNPIPFRCPT
jgi:hypothetical protein